MIAFVEGSMERQFLNNFMKYVHVVPVSNGITWTVDRMCGQITTAYEALDLPGTVFVWIDREGRVETALEIYDRIRISLLNAGAPPEDTHILINDRMSENVILADEQIIRAEFGDPEYTYTMAGLSGKAKLKTMFGNRGIHYRETNHGIKLLKKIRLSRCALACASTARFMETFVSECWWTREQSVV